MLRAWCWQVWGLGPLPAPTLRSPSPQYPSSHVKEKVTFLPPPRVQVSPFSDHPRSPSAIGQRVQSAAIVFGGKHLCLAHQPPCQYTVTPPSPNTTEPPAATAQDLRECWARGAWVETHCSAPHPLGTYPPMPGKLGGSATRSHTVANTSWPIWLDLAWFSLI